MKTKEITNQIRKILIKNIDGHVLSSEKKYFKEEIKMHGVRISAVTRISKEYYTILKNRPKQEMFRICEELWKSGYSEEGYMACNLSYYIHTQYETTDFVIFQSWLENYVSNWATCDTLCNHTIGTFLEMYPQYIENLKEWALSSNRWMRRGAAVSLIIPARKGLFIEDIFEISNLLLADKDDLVQKGYGWMLKAASESHLQEVYDYLISKKSVMPRTAYRYGLEKMPEEMKAEAMKK